MTGLIPGIATNSLAEGGSTSGGESSAPTKARRTTNATINIAKVHTQREISP